jgi:hypothetical protein
MADMNRMVFEKLEAMCATHYSSTHLKPFRKKHDGRGAWLALTSNYLGGDGMNTQAVMYENRIKNLRYYKDTGRSDLETVLTKWKDAISGLKTLVPLGYSMPDESTQVRTLMDVIEHPELKTACNPLILADDSFRRDPQKCMHLYLNFWRRSVATKKRNQSVYVSALDATDITRYYSSNEYKNMSPEEKRQVFEARKTKGGNKGNGKGKGKGGGNNKSKKKKRTVAAANANGNNNNNNNNSDDKDDSADNNCNHSALNPSTRQQGTIGKKQCQN